MIKVTVHESNWYRGRGGDESRLLLAGSYNNDSHEGKMCCIGFLARACGVEDQEMLDVPATDGLDNVPEGMGWMVEYGSEGECMSSDEANRIYAMNDRDDISDVERKSELKRLLAAHGVDMEFV